MFLCRRLRYVHPTVAPLFVALRWCAAHRRRVTTVAVSPLCCVSPRCVPAVSRGRRSPLRLVASRVRAHPSPLVVSGCLTHLVREKLKVDLLVHSERTVTRARCEEPPSILGPYCVAAGTVRRPLCPWAPSLRIFVWVTRQHCLWPVVARLDTVIDPAHCCALDNPNIVSNCSIVM